MKEKEVIRRGRTVRVGKALAKRYEAMRQASRGVNSDHASTTARELHLKIFYSDYRPYPGEETVSISHPLLAS